MHYLKNSLRFRPAYCFSRTGFILWSLGNYRVAVVDYTLAIPLGKIVVVDDANQVCIFTENFCKGRETQVINCTNNGTLQTSSVEA